MVTQTVKVQCSRRNSTLCGDTDSDGRFSAAAGTALSVVTLTVMEGSVQQKRQKPPGSRQADSRWRGRLTADGEAD